MPRPPDRSDGGGEPLAPRQSFLPTPLAVKAEVVLGALLVARHRTVRLAAVLAALVIATGAIGTDAAPSAGVHSVLVVAGALSAVAASRLVAPGAALSALRRAAGPFWLAPVGRLAGALIAVGPFALVAALVMEGNGLAAYRLAAIALALAAGLGALSLGLAPWWGASAAGGATLMLALFGTIPPSGMMALTDPVPVLGPVSVVSWNVLPLAWRASRWVHAGTLADGLVLGSWVVLGCLLAAWAGVDRGRR